VKFPRKNFYKFLNALRVDTKEYGSIALGTRLLGTQKYLIDQIADGFDNGIHDFIVLKARQLGITVICLALDLYWALRFPGMSETLTTDTDENREMFRITLAMYVESLPEEFVEEVVSHNRVQLVFKNRSRLAYQVAGTKKSAKASVGVGKAIMFAHLTEVSNWGNDEALDDMEASFAQQNPLRLYVRESTARGFNAYYDAWEVAKTSRTQRAIFIGWWRNELYRVERTDFRFQHYWDEKLTTEERAWVREVKKLYDYDIAPEQIVWWRWMADEKMTNEAALYQNYPPTENYAFQATGSQFFPSLALSDRLITAKRSSHSSYRFILGSAFEDTELMVSKDKVATLKVWEHPETNGYYTLGGDPAWGSSDWADRFCASVYRCYADGLEQVAEFCTAECTTQQFAWVLLYLAATYSTEKTPLKMNLEINGPGQAVFQEFQNLKRLAASYDSGHWPMLGRVLANVHNFLYHRIDSLAGGYAYHWKTTEETKSRMLNRMKDHFMSGQLIIRSADCLEEMKIVRQEDGHFIDPGRKKDDRVIATALAVVPWDDTLRIVLAQMRHSRSNVEKAKDMTREGTQVARLVNTYLSQIGVLKH
jgi:hypothetical protein